MTNLLKKEFNLAFHPLVPVMLLLSLMVFIPNYPYSVTFFYLTLAVFFICLSGRENGDVRFSLLLPVSKRDIVKSRILFTAILQIAQLAVLMLFVVLKNQIYANSNLAGMDANIALIAEGFLIFGFFNLVFFCSYYKNVNKVGLSFIKASFAVFVLIIADVIVSNAVPFVIVYIDNTEIQFVKYRIILLAICIVLYILLTFFAIEKSVLRFEKQDV